MRALVPAFLAFSLIISSCASMMAPMTTPYQAIVPPAYHAGDGTELDLDIQGGVSFASQPFYIPSATAAQTPTAIMAQGALALQLSSVDSRRGFHGLVGIGGWYGQDQLTVYQNPGTTTNERLSPESWGLNAQITALYGRSFAQKMVIAGGASIRAFWEDGAAWQTRTEAQLRAPANVNLQPEHLGLVFYIVPIDFSLDQPRFGRLHATMQVGGSGKVLLIVEKPENKITFLASNFLYSILASSGLPVLLMDHYTIGIVYELPQFPMYLSLATTLYSPLTLADIYDIQTGATLCLGFRM